jgi:16S rRNA (guanine527-N7)-methyltransferase
VAERTTRTRLLRRAGKGNIFITETQADRLATYLDLLFRWNRKINLTALTDADEAIDRLLLEPLIAARQLPSGRGRLIDIGSGGGSPAIPLALALGDYAVTMVESKARKAAFLREVARVLDLSHVGVETTRFQSLLNEASYQGAYSAFSIRAVRTERQTLTELASFLASGGLGLVFRGPGGSEQGVEAPPLLWVGTHPLIPSLGSRLTLYRLSR